MNPAHVSLLPTVTLHTLAQSVSVVAAREFLAFKLSQEKYGVHMPVG